MGASISNAAKDFGILTKIDEGTLTIPTASTKIFTATEDCLFAFVATSNRSYFSLNRDATSSTSGTSSCDFYLIYAGEWFAGVGGDSPNIAEILKRNGYWLGQYPPFVFSIRLKAGDYICGISERAYNPKYFVFK